jgi:hypothetical protein
MGLLKASNKRFLTSFNVLNVGEVFNLADVETDYPLSKKALFQPKKGFFTEGYLLRKKCKKLN